MSEVYKVALDLALVEDGDESKLPASALRAKSGVPLSVSSIPVESVDLPPIKGRVEGCWTTTPTTVEPKQSFLLPDGETIRLPEGSAVSIYKGHGGWSDCQFPLGGRLVGPLCYASAPPADPVKLVRDHTWRDRLDRAHNILAIGVVSTCLLWVFGGLDAIELLPETGHARALGLATWIVTPVVGFVWLAGWGQDALNRRLEKRENRLPKDLPNPPRKDFDVALPDRLRSLAGYDPALIEAKLSHYKADDLDREIEAAASAYKAKRRELQRMAGPEVATIEHSASMLHEIAQKIAGSPRVLCDRETKKAFLELIGRAQEQVELRLARKDAAISADVMADIAALSTQIDCEIGIDKSTQS
jgi:hypothetical protein